MADLAAVEAAVAQKLSQTDSLISSWMSQAQSFLTTLLNLAQGQQIPTIDIRPNLFAPGAIDVSAPEPQRPPMDISTPNSPSPFIPTAIYILSPDKVDPLAAPLNWQFSFAERDYVSSLLDAVKAKLLRDTVNGSTGLDPSVEDAMFTRMQERDEKMMQKTIQKLADTHAAFGWDLPQGTLNENITAALLDYDDKKKDQSRDIMIEMAKIADGNQRFTTQTAVAYEGMMIQHADNVMNRALTAARSVVELGVLVYNAWVERYKAMLEAIKIQSSIDIANAELQEKLEDLQLKAFLGNVDLYKTNFSMLLEKIRTLATVYGVDIQKYHAQATISEAKARIAVTQQEIVMKNIDSGTALTVQQAIANLQAFVQIANTRVAAAGHGGMLFAQAVSGALNAVNTLVQIGDSAQVIGTAS